MKNGYVKPKGVRKVVLLVGRLKVWRECGEERELIKLRAKLSSRPMLLKHNGLHTNESERKYGRCFGTHLSMLKTSVIIDLYDANLMPVSTPSHTNSSLAHNVSKTHNGVCLFFYK